MNNNLGSGEPLTITAYLIDSSTYPISVDANWSGTVDFGMIGVTKIVVSGANVSAAIDDLSGDTEAVAAGPTVVAFGSTTANGSYKVGDTIAVNVTFSETLTVTGTPQLTLETGTTDRVVNYASGSGGTTLTFNYTVQAGDSSADLDYVSTTALALNGGTIKNGSGTDATLTLPSPGDMGSLGASKALVIDGVAPEANAVDSPTADGTYKTGDVIEISVSFSESVMVTGTPQLTLETGTTDRAVTYASGSGTSTLIFNYTVQAGDSAADLDYVSTSALALNGGTIKDAAGNNATLTLAAPGNTGSLAANANLVIDTAVPSVSASAPAGGALAGDASVSFTVTFSETVQNVTADDFALTATGTAAGTISAVSAAMGSSVTVAVASITGAGTLRLDVLSSSDITDAGGTALAADFTSGTLHTVDRVAPVVSSVAVPANGTYAPGQNLDFTVTFNEAVTVNTGGGTPRIGVTLDTGGSQSASYLSGSGTTALTFRLTLAAGRQDLNGVTVAGTIDANGGTLTDAAGNAANLTLNNVASTSGVLVDDAAPAVTAVTAPANGTYKAGAALDFSVTFTEAITVDSTGGVPRLMLTIGSSSVPASYQSGSGTTTLVFRHVVAAGENDVDGLAITTLSSNGGTLRNAMTTDASLTLSGVANTANLRIDTTAPTLTIASSSLALKAGQTATLSFQFSEAPLGFDAADISGLSGGTMGALTVDGSDPTLYRASFTAGTDIDLTTSMSVANGSYTDLVGNGGIGASMSGLKIDTRAPGVSLTAPSGPQSAAFTASVQFTETVTGFDLADVSATNASLSALTGAGASYVFTVTPSGAGDVTLSVAAGAAQDAMGNASAAAAPVTVAYGASTVATEFAAHRDEIRTIVTEQATQSLRGSLDASQRMVGMARDRLTAHQARMAGQDGAEPLQSGLQWEGSADANQGFLSTKGSVSGQTDLGNGWRRVVFGDFALIRNDEGAATVALDGRLAWEKLLSDRTLIGWYLGANLASSSIDQLGFDGDIRSHGLSLGGYGVRQLTEHLMLDGFVSAGLGQNDLSLSNSVLDLDSRYASRSLQAGIALSGAIPMQGFVLQTELALAHATLQMGEIGLTGQAHGQTDDSLTLDAGTVGLTSLSFRPEIRIALDGAAPDQALSLLTLAPLLRCDRQTGPTEGQDCGGGLDLTLTSQSADGARQLRGAIGGAHVGDTTTARASIELDYRF